ncbi:glycoside hydrolase family 16 protein [Streptomyces sp. AN091965]|uniref:glycoside hydrolase family 16 protein n=1 Tax=Streptomyces sp. AN091965 TaxID=2927803 RepID=UPI001F621FC9|nr:glycoside hydrolase family 16 protein [Streptomyces sp. AN091965]MCI3928756.1 glycoside hydrolase family 16 protein [Streptomyces sp. AN091965]
MRARRAPFRLLPRTPLHTALLTGLATLALTAPLLAPGPANADMPPAPAWTLQWSDDFDGPARSLPSAAHWQIDTGHNYPGGPADWGTGEVQNYTSSADNVALDGGGNLRITPLRDAAGAWTSGRVETRRADFKAPADGTLAIESRIRMPNVTGEQALGYWPAFWALGAPYRGNYWNWPSIGEFDVMENVNGIDSVWGVLHCGVNPGGPCDETNGIGASRACPGAPCQSAFHTYRFEWDRSASPNVLRWFVDGQLFHSVDQNRVGAQAWNDMTGHAGYFILLNVAMGGGFPDGVAGRATPVAATVPGRSMLVDYVAVWTRGGGGGDPGTPSTLHLRPGGTLGEATGTASAATLASAGGPHHDGTPHAPQTFTATGVNGTHDGGSTQFDLLVDAGTTVANGQQVRVSYDRTGDGSWDRTETYRYFATDPVPGYEHYTQGQGLKSATGEHGPMRGGTVRVEVWNAIGNGPSTLGIGNQSVVRIPFG